MTRYGLVCLLLGSFFSYQVIRQGSLLEAQTSATAKTTTREVGHESEALTVASNKPLITIVGLCDNPSPDKAAASDCETIITQAQFGKVIDAIQPDMRARARREFALHYAEVLVMTNKAEQMGLDKGPNYEEQMRLARLQILSQELKKVIQERSSQISEKDIGDYYRNNTAKFEKVKIDRIYVPKIQQALSTSGKELSDTDRQKGLQKSEQTMKVEADNLRARAIAGEEFAILQADAYQAAGIKSVTPNTKLMIRRTSLPQNQVLVMDLKPGEVSAVLADPNGYDIYKVDTKETLSLDQVREEIKSALRSQRMQDEMRSIQDSATTTLDESYFGRSRSQ
jgi:hypothetical protein